MRFRSPLRERQIVASSHSLRSRQIMRSVILPYLVTRGFVEGRNLVVDVRVGTKEQMPELAQALVGYKADVIIAASDWALHAAVQRTRSRLSPHQQVRPVRARPTRAATSRRLIAPNLRSRACPYFVKHCLRCI